MSGQVPPELGDLTGLVNLFLGYTMLSGSFPESMSGLSAIEWLNLDGSGLCVPDTPAMREWVLGIGDFRGAVCEGSASFSRMVTPLDLGRIDSVFAVVDLNGDGHDDVLGGVDLEQNAAAPERLTKAPLHVFVGGGRRRLQARAGASRGRDRRAQAGRGRGRLQWRRGDPDLAVFDYGVYVHEESVGVGNPPQLFLSGQDGRLHPSQALADAVRRQHERDPQGPAKGISGSRRSSSQVGDVGGHRRRW